MVQVLPSPDVPQPLELPEPRDLSLEAVVPQSKVSETSASSWAGSLSKPRQTRSELQLLKDHADDEEIKPKLRRARRSSLDWLLGTHTGQWFMMIVCGVSIIVFGSVGLHLACSTDAPSDVGCSQYDVWFAYTMFIDIGTQTGLDNTHPWQMKYGSVLISLLGFMWSLTFLGIVVERMRSLLDYWRRDRQRIVLTGHTLVLGWSEKSSFLLNEMIHQAESKSHGRTIVIMAEQDELAIQQEIRRQLKLFLQFKSCWRWLVNYWRIHIVARHGCIFDVEDLERVSASSAREVVVLGQGDSRKSDLGVLRSVIALAALPDEPSGRVVAEIQHPEFVLVLRGLLPGIESIVARITVNKVLSLLAARPKVGYIFMRLLTFTTGEQLYAVCVPRLTGSTFGEACCSFQRAMCVGLKSSRGRVVLAPGDDHVLQQGDKLILIAEKEMDVVGRAAGKAYARMDRIPSASIAAPTELLGAALDGAVLAASSAAHATSAVAEMTTKGVQRTISTGRTAVKRASRNFIANRGSSGFLSGDQNISLDDGADEAVMDEEEAPPKIHTFVVIGWCNDMLVILQQLAHLVSSGSEVHVLSELDREEREKSLEGRSLANTVIVHHIGERCSVNHLADLPLQDATAILVLSEGKRQRLPEGIPVEDTDDAITSDSVCLACMQLVTSILHGLRLEGPMPHIICEVNDPRTDRVLARNQALRQRATFLRSGALEMGLFNIAATDATSFNTLVHLLSQTVFSSELGLDVIPISSLVNGLPDIPDERSAAPRHQLSFLELNQKLRDRDGALLLGWLRGGQCYLPIIERHVQLSWCREDHLIVLQPDRDMLE